MTLNQLTIQQALEGLEKKDFSRVELVQACLDQIKAHDKELNAFLLVREEEALAQAKEMDGKPLGLPLEGIPIALKDMYVTKGVRTTAASQPLSSYVPQYDATVVQKLKEAGAIIIGKLNQDAWAHGSSGENSQFGPAKNPWDQTKVAGGSSSGSAASLAADMCLASSGTDTCGSIRLPASFCGVVGLKPTYGRVSRYGIVAMASSLDTIGHLTKSMWDSAIYLEVTAGQDPLDATTPAIPVPSYTESLNRGIEKVKGLRIGIPKEYFGKGLDTEVEIAVKTALKELEKMGAIIMDISLPHTDYGLATYYIVQPSEVSSNLSRYDGIRYGLDRSTFGDEAKRRIMIGTYSLSSGYYDAYYKKAMKVRTLIMNDFTDSYKKVDVIVTPTGATPAFGLAAKTDPLQMYLTDIYAAPSSLAGIPGLQVPCGFTKSGLPIGMQIMGPHFSEELLFQVGYAYEQATPWHTMKPKNTGSRK